MALTRRRTAAIAGALLATVALEPARALATTAAPAGILVAIGAAPTAPGQAVATTVPAPDEQTELTVVLQPRDARGLDRFVSDVSTPGSALYQHYLAPGEFAARFGASPQAIADVTTALRASGLRVASVAANGLSLHVTGSVSQVGSALHTSFRRYELSSGGTELANTSAPELPASIASQVQGVVGLDSVTTAVHTQVALTAATMQGATAAALPHAAGAPTACSAATSVASSTGAYTADQLAHHYDVDSFYSKTTGQGVTVALFELEPFAAGDVAAFQTCYGTSAAVSIIHVDGGAGSGTGTGEAALDVEGVIGLAPSASVLVYDAPNTTGSMYDAYQRIASDDRAQVVSTSWSLCESASGVASLAALERPLFQQMAAQGQTVLAATGESGSEGCYAPPSSSDTSLAVRDPASQPEVTAVGGTSLATIGAADRSWNGASGASGGGISRIWPMPAYQRALATIADSTGLACGSTTTLCREVPDISASADPDHGYVVYFGSAWHAVGGTDAAAPLVAAIIALTDSACSARSVGFVNPALYAIAATGTGSTDPIVDVTTGPSNDFTGSHSGQYPVRGGYDLATGLGRPDAGRLGAALCPALGAAGSGTVSVSPNLVQTSSLATLTFTYSPASGDGMIDGRLEITVPGTWSLPTTTPGAPGYTTASAGVVSVTSNTILVSGLTLAAGQSIDVVYGDTSAGGSGAQTPAAPQVTTFAAADAPTDPDPLTALGLSPAVRVLTSGSTAAGQGTLTRVAGNTRIETAIAASQVGYPGADSAAAVVLARSDTYPDALAGVPFAAYLRGPLLLTPPAGLPGEVETEIQRVLRPGGSVFVLGGTAALSTTVDAQLQALGYVPRRIEGADRFATALQIAHALGDPTTVFEADGTGFADALSAGPAAIITHGAVLLTSGSTADPGTAAYLAGHPGDTRYAVGGPAAQADRAATPFVGADRFETSVLVARHFFTAPSGIGIASGAAFPDALSGGPVAGNAGGPLVLVPPGGSLPGTTQSYFSGVASSVLSGWLFGGTAAISTSVASAAAQALVLVPPPS